MNRLFTLTLVSVTCAWNASCSGRKTHKRPPVAVELEKATIQQLSKPYVIFGETAAISRSVLSFEVSGVVESTKAEEGEPVKTGQLLASLDKESTKLSLALSRDRLREASVAYKKMRGGYRQEVVRQYYLSYKQAQAAHDKAKSDFEAGTKLWNSKTISRTQYVQRKTSYESARAAMNKARTAYRMYLKGYQKEDVQAAGVKTSQARTQLRMAKKQLRDTELRAPFTGVVSKRNVNVGELVPAGKTAFEIVDIHQIEVNLGVPERLIHQVSVGQKAFVAVDAKSPMTQGTIQRKGVDLDRQTLTYPVVVRLANPIVRYEKKRPVRRYLPGMLVATFFYSRQRFRGISVPLDAILDDGRKKSVFISEKGRARRVEVKTGRLVGNRIEVKGIKAGALVVVRGQHRLSPGRQLYAVRVTSFQLPDFLREGAAPARLPVHQRLRSRGAR